MIVYPACTIESGMALAAAKERRVIDKDVRYEESSHHKLRNASVRKQLNPRYDPKEFDSW